MHIVDVKDTRMGGTFGEYGECVAKVGRLRRFLSRDSSRATNKS